MFEVGDKVRVTKYPKEIGVVKDIIRGQGRTATIMVKLNRISGGANHVIVYAHELEEA